MLIRIAPEMFIKSEYECCTIRLVRKELFWPQKFKTKYPWRIQFKDKVKPLAHDISDNEDVHRYFDAIDSLIEHGRINDISYVISLLPTSTVPYIKQVALRLTRH